MAMPGGSDPERPLPGEDPSSERQRVQPGDLPGGASDTQDEGPTESSDSSDPLLHTSEVQIGVAGLRWTPLPHPGTTSAQCMQPLLI